MVVAGIITQLEVFESRFFQFTSQMRGFKAVGEGSALQASAGISPFIFNDITDIPALGTSVAFRTGYISLKALFKRLEYK